MSEPKPGILEGQTLERDQALDCDVCIIGSGAGGAVTAHTLAKAGLKVIVLEEGGYFTQSRFRMREADAYPELYQDGGQRATKDLSIAVYQGRAVGGSTVVNWTTCFHTPDPVLAHWKTHFGVNLTSKTLAPHYQAIEKRLNIHAVGQESVNANNKVLQDGCKALDYSSSFLRRNVKSCAKTGYCGMGCPVDAKQSMLITYLPDAVDAGATVISRCRVDALKLSGTAVTQVRGTLLDAWGRAPTGQSVTVTAKKVVVAGGAINTPALLMRSGVPDPHGLLGTRTFLHPVVASMGRFEHEINGFYGAPQSIATHQFAERGDAVGFFIETAPVHPTFAGTAVPNFGQTHRDVMTDLPFTAAHLALAIDGFHEGVFGGRVSVAPSGHPVLDYTPEPKVFEALKQAQKELARIQFAAGAKEVRTLHDPAFVMKKEADIAGIDKQPYAPNRVFVGSAHQMGGARMSDVPSTGVVRFEDLRHHQLTNLHVIDGSVFPTSLGVNPQLSVYGLAHLVSSRLAAVWA